MKFRIGNLENLWNNGFWRPKYDKILSYNIPEEKKCKRQEIDANNPIGHQSFEGTHLFIVSKTYLEVCIKEKANG